MSGIEEKVDDLMIVRAIDKGKFVRVNDSFSAKVGYNATELAEKPFLDWIAPCDRTIVQTALENGERSFFVRHITRDGSTLQLEIQVAEHEEGLFVLGRCAQAPTQREYEAARSAEATVLGTLDAIARIIEEQNTGYKCSILLVAEGRFVFGAGPSLPSEYNSAVNGYAIGPTIGSCGTAIFWNTPVIVADIQADPLWVPLAALAKKAGVAACWSHPFVSSSGKVLGALALYSPEPRAPTTEQLSRLKVAARITGLAVERGRVEEELKRANQATKAARNQLQATLNALPDLLFEVDAEGRIFSYHTHRSDLLAAPPEAFMGKRFADVLPPDAADACQRAINEAAQNGFSYGEAYRLALPHGEHWFELSVAPLQADTNSDPRFVMISHNITERKRQERRLALALDASKVVVWEMDFTTGKMGYDGGAIIGLGLDKADAPDTLVGWQARVHADDRTRFSEKIEQALQPDDTRGFDFEYRFDDNAGSYHWLQSVGRVLQRDAAGRPLLAAGYSVNIDERKKAEEELRKLSLAMEQSSESIVITNLDAEIEYVNEAFIRNTGYRREEIIGQNPRILQSGKTPQTTFDSLWLAMTEGEPWKGEFHNRRRDGSEYNEFAVITPLRQADGKITHYVAVKDDITEKKRLGEELDQYRHHLEDQVALRTNELMLAKIQAEAASRAKSAFLANMSHELRTPMNGVLGMIELAKRRMADAKGLDHLDKAKLSANRLLGVLNDILDISKIEADRMVFESIPMQISAVVEVLTSTLGHKATEKGLRLSIDLPADFIKQPFKGDPLRLGQILFNLVGNAIKFTPQGAVTLRIRSVGETTEAVQVRFEVSDTGIGIEPAAQTRLFQSFEQADNSMTRKYGGTGLGLAITKRLVQLMGGEIGIESTVGQGSNFWFIVPLKKREQSATPTAPTFGVLPAGHRLKTEYEGRRILLAEDEPITQEISRDLLEDLGLVVDVAEDGQQALELASLNTYALILMDMQMPHMNGIDATKAIRALPGYAQTPILALTANAFDEDRQVCLDAGMNDYIAKPVAPDALCEILLRWLRESAVAVPV